MSNGRSTMLDKTHVVLANDAYEAANTVVAAATRLQYKQSIVEKDWIELYGAIQSALDKHQALKDFVKTRLATQTPVVFDAHDIPQPRMAPPVDFLEQKLINVVSAHPSTLIQPIIASQ